MTYEDAKRKYGKGMADAGQRLIDNTPAGVTMTVSTEGKSATIDGKGRGSKMPEQQVLTDDGELVTEQQLLARLTETSLGSCKQLISDQLKLGQSVTLEVLAFCNMTGEELDDKGREYNVQKLKVTRIRVTEVGT
jgi:hypothetical protein